MLHSFFRAPKCHNSQFSMQVPHNETKQDTRQTSWLSCHLKQIVASPFMGTLRQAFLDANACQKKKIGGGLGTLISQHLCSEGRFFGGTPSVTSGQQWTKRFHNRSRTDLADKLHAQIDLLCFVSNQEMVKVCVEA